MKVIMSRQLSGCPWVRFLKHIFPLEVTIVLTMAQWTLVRKGGTNKVVLRERAEKKKKIPHVLGCISFYIKFVVKKILKNFFREQIRLFTDSISRCNLVW